MERLRPGHVHIQLEAAISRAVYELEWQSELVAPGPGKKLYRHDHSLRRRTIMEGRGCIRCSRSDFTARILRSARPGRSHTEFRIAKNRQRDTAALSFACIHSPDIRARRRADQQRIRSAAARDDRGQ